MGKKKKNKEVAVEETSVAKASSEPTPKTAWRIEYLIRTLSAEGGINDIKAGYSARTEEDARTLVSREIADLQSKRRSDGSLTYKKVKLLRLKVAEVPWEDAMAAEPIEAEDNPEVETFEEPAVDPVEVPEEEEAEEEEALPENSSPPEEDQEDPAYD